MKNLFKGLLAFSIVVGSSTAVVSCLPISSVINDAKGPASSSYHVLARNAGRTTKQNNIIESFKILKEKQKVNDDLNHLLYDRKTTSTEFRPYLSLGLPSNSIEAALENHNFTENKASYDEVSKVAQIKNTNFDLLNIHDYFTQVGQNLDEIIVNGMNNQINQNDIKGTLYGFSEDEQYDIVMNKKLEQLSREIKDHDMTSEKAIRVSFGNNFGTSLWKQAWKANVPITKLASYFANFKLLGGTNNEMKINKFDFVFDETELSFQNNPLASENYTNYLASALYEAKKINHNLDIMLTITNVNPYSYNDPTNNSDIPPTPLAAFTKYLGLDFTLNITSSASFAASIDKEPVSSALIKIVKKAASLWSDLNQKINKPINSVPIEQIFNRMGITPYIGKFPGSEKYLFDLEDAKILKKFADENNLQMLSMNYINKDIPGNDSDDSSWTVSQIVTSSQKINKYDFTRVFTGMETDQYVSKEDPLLNFDNIIGDYDNFFSGINTNKYQNKNLLYMINHPQQASQYISDHGSNHVIASTSELQGTDRYNWQVGDKELNAGTTIFDPYIDATEFNGLSNKKLQEMVTKNNSNITISYVEQEYGVDDKMSLSIGGLTPEMKNYNQIIKTNVTDTFLKPFANKGMIKNITFALGGPNTEVIDTPWAAAAKLVMKEYGFNSIEQLSNKMLNNAGEKLAQSIIKFDNDTVSSVNLDAKKDHLNYSFGLESLFSSVAKKAMSISEVYKYSEIVGSAIAYIKKHEPSIQFSLAVPVGIQGFNNNVANAILTIIRKLAANGTSKNDLPFIEIMYTGSDKKELEEKSIKNGAQAVIGAINNVFKNYTSIIQKTYNGIQLTSAQIFSKFKITPIVGITNNNIEFSLNDAAELYNFAVHNSIGEISMWNLNKDVSSFEYKNTTNPEIGRFVQAFSGESNGLGYLEFLDFAAILSGNWTDEILNREN